MGANEILHSILCWANQLLPVEELTAGKILPFKTPKSVLLVPSKFIGDNILLTPFIRNLRRNLGPDARIDIVATAASAPLFETLPGLNAVYIEDTGELRRPKSFLKKQGYDTVMLCRYSLFWGRAAKQINIPQRVGFDLERLGLHGVKCRGQELTHAIPSTSVCDARPQVEIYLDMLRQLGLRVYDKALECPLTEADLAKASQLLAALPPQAPHILIHAACGSPGKQWPAENWTALLHLLAQQYGAVFIAVGSQGDRAAYQAWEHEVPLLNLCGQTSTRESIALMRTVDLVVTLDTSVAHMAAAAGTPRLIVLYGPTNQAKWRPWVQSGTFLEQVYLNLPCHPCMARTCEHKSCIRQLTVTRVMQAVNRAFRQA